MSFLAEDVPQYKNVARDQANIDSEKDTFIESSALLSMLENKNLQEEVPSSTEQKEDPASKLIDSVEHALSEIRLATSTEMEGLLSLERVLAAHAEIKQAVKLYEASISKQSNPPVVTGIVKADLLQGKESGELCTRTYNALNRIVLFAKWGTAPNKEHVFATRGPVESLKDYEKFTQGELLSAKNLGKTSLAEALEFFEKRGVVIRP